MFFFMGTGRIQNYPLSFWKKRIFSWNSFGLYPCLQNENLYKATTCYILVRLSLSNDLISHHFIWRSIKLQEWFKKTVFLLSQIPYSDCSYAVTVVKCVQKRRARERWKLSSFCEVTISNNLQNASLQVRFTRVFWISLLVDTLYSIKAVFIETRGVVRCVLRT